MSSVAEPADAAASSRFALLHADWLDVCQRIAGVGLGHVESWRRSDFSDSGCDELAVFVKGDAGS
jgi:hypothetical protein